jgi:deoxyribonuclease V
MEIKKQWLFPSNIDEAKAAQKEMCQKVILSDSTEKSLLHVAGMDVSNTPFDPEQLIYGAAVVLSYPSLTVVEIITRLDKQPFPYIPGLLGFREVPTLFHTYNQLSIKPDVIMVDGHGVSHPRGLGIATHLGILLEVPTIGVAKTILVGSPASPLPENPGSMVPLIWKGREIGIVLRTKQRATPLIISAGHKITLPTAVQLVLSCLKEYRLPEPTRQAHLAANRCRKEALHLRKGGYLYEK